MREPLYTDQYCLVLTTHESLSQRLRFYGQGWQPLQDVNSVSAQCCSLQSNLQTTCLVYKTSDKREKYLLPQYLVFYSPKPKTFSLLTIKNSSSVNISFVIVKNKIKSTNRQQQKAFQRWRPHLLQILRGLFKILSICLYVYVQNVPQKAVLKNGLFW